jgi:hypothetical protein
MFKIKAILFFLITFTLQVLLFSCEKERHDNSKPFINILSPKALELVHILSGEELKLELFFKDNKELSQFKVSIKNDFENTLQPDKMISSANDFSTILVKKLSGSEVQESINIKIDELAMSGIYSVTVNCVDASGNQAESVNLNIHVSCKIDSIPVNINVITPKEGTNYLIDSLIQVNAVLEDLNNNGNTGFVYDYEVKLINQSDESEIFKIRKKINKKSPQSFTQELPKINEAGDYIIKITARDDFNNLSTVSKHIRVH